MGPIARLEHIPTEEWEIKLIEETRRLVRHEWGNLEFHVAKEKDCIRVSIRAGEWWNFRVKK